MAVGEECYPLRGKSCLKGVGLVEGQILRLQKHYVKGISIQKPERLPTLKGTLHFLAQGLQ